MNNIYRVVVHHSASAPGTTLEQIDQWHRDKGWAGIGYHFVIETNGRLRYGRRLPELGAHAKGANTGSIGICFVGDFTKDPAGPTFEQRTTFRALRGALDLIWPGLVYFPHGNVGSTATECPGFDIATLK